MAESSIDVSIATIENIINELKRNVSRMHDDRMEFTQYNRRANAFTGMETAAVDRFGGKFDANQHEISLAFRRRVFGFSSAGRVGDSYRTRRQGNRS